VKDVWNGYRYVFFASIKMIKCYQLVTLPIDWHIGAKQNCFYSWINNVKILKGKKVCIVDSFPVKEFVRLCEMSLSDEDIGMIIVEAVGATYSCGITKRSRVGVWCLLGIGQHDPVRRHSLCCYPSSVYYRLSGFVFVYFGGVRVEHGVHTLYVLW
jgi:hypothetical protein